jgi:hypothetical protein
MDDNMTYFIIGFLVLVFLYLWLNYNSSSFKSFGIINRPLPPSPLKCPPGKKLMVSQRGGETCSGFSVSNNLNFGPSPYEDYVKNTTYDSTNPGDELYMWEEIKSPDLNVITPEYNNKTGIVDYRFGNQVYDSDTAQVVSSFTNY